jgi:NAD-dependent deacetylase
MNTDKNIVFFTGAGISALAGIKTFRDHDGLWENHKIEDVATPEAWAKNPKLVLDFYNQRRRQLADVQPTKAHKLIAEIQNGNKNISIITQNVDDLHERAGAKNIVHLHGELTKVRSTRNPSHIKDIGYNDLTLHDVDENGDALRPHIVWFGEDVPMMDYAQHKARLAEVFVIIGTSLNVYPAAGLLHFVPPYAEVWIIDPKPNNFYPDRIHEIALDADQGMEHWINLFDWR